MIVTTMFPLCILLIKETNKFIISSSLEIGHILCFGSDHIFKTQIKTLDLTEDCVFLMFEFITFSLSNVTEIKSYLAIPLANTFHLIVLKKCRFGLLYFFFGSNLGLKLFFFFWHIFFDMESTMTVRPEFNMN